MTIDTQTIIVFGGAGFIGHHLLKRLRSTQKNRVISVDLKAPHFPVEGVDYRLGDVRNLSGFEAGGPVNRIYNLAAVHTTPGHPAHEYYETNIAGATEIIAFARRASVNEIVFTSSISVYGPGEECKDETTSPSPTSAYGWSKYLAEGIHRAWVHENVTRRLLIVRPAVIFGPHENGNFTRMAKLLKKGFFIYPGRRDTVKACFYVEDLLDALDQAFSVDDRYILLNACYPDRYTTEQIVRAFCRAGITKFKEFTIPYAMVKSIAMLLGPLSLFNLGIHPERVSKLMHSTNIFPGWLTANSFVKTGRLEAALRHWGEHGNFE